MVLISVDLVPSVTYPLEIGHAVSPRPASADLGDEFVVFERVDTVVDAIDADVADTLPEVDDGVLLIDIAVHGELVALGTGVDEDLLELDRRVVSLVGVEPDSHDPVPILARLVQRLGGRLGRQIAKKTHDQL